MSFIAEIKDIRGDFRNARELWNRGPLEKIGIALTCLSNGVLAAAVTIEAAAATETKSVAFHIAATALTALISTALVGRAALASLAAKNKDKHYQQFIRN